MKAMYFFAFHLSSLNVYPFSLMLSLLQLLCWGFNRYGEVGSEDLYATFSSENARSLLNSEDSVRVAVGESHTCVCVASKEVNT